MAQKIQYIHGPDHLVKGGIVELVDDGDSSIAVCLGDNENLADYSFTGNLEFRAYSFTRSLKGTKETTIQLITIPEKKISFRGGKVIMPKNLHPEFFENFND